MSQAREEVSRVLNRINQAWLQGRPGDIGAFLEDDVVMALPGFAESIKGKTALVQSFVSFCQSATVHDFEVSDVQVDVSGTAAVANVAFIMIYERDAQKYRSTGRDLWVFTKRDDSWRAAWRTMLDLAEEPVP